MHGAYKRWPLCDLARNYAEAKGIRDFEGARRSLLIQDLSSGQARSAPSCAPSDARASLPTSLAAPHTSLCGAICLFLAAQVFPKIEDTYNELQQFMHEDEGRVERLRVEGKVDLEGGHSSQVDDSKRPPSLYQVTRRREESDEGAAPSRSAATADHPCHRRQNHQKSTTAAPHDSRATHRLDATRVQVAVDLRNDSSQELSGALIEEIIGTVGKQHAYAIVGYGPVVVPLLTTIVEHEKLTSFLIFKVVVGVVARTLHTHIHIHPRKFRARPAPSTCALA